ncbi:DUF4142 domain-containing protein [Pilimelia terevasa]|nr:DUF4142 domain-containing protein [Pilimelia terevasa]
MVLLSPGVAGAEPGVPVPPNDLLTDTGKGDVSEADRDFVVKVRLAGLWEMPAGELAQDRSNSRRIKSIGRDIADQHQELDELVRAAAKKLDVALPDDPNKDQQGWLDEMREAEGTEFDQIYIDRLRAAHGKIFPAIATIRASTRNDTVRKLAQRANQFVMTHMTLLESSSIVDFAALPTAPPPAPAAASGAGATTQVVPAANLSTPGPSMNLSLLVVIAVAGLGVAVFVTTRLVRNLGSGRHRRATPS